MLWVVAVPSELRSLCNLDITCLCVCAPAGVCIPVRACVHMYCHQEIPLKLFSCFKRIPPGPVLFTLDFGPVRASSLGKSNDGREESRPPPRYSAFDLGTVTGTGHLSSCCVRGGLCRSPKGVELCLGRARCRALSYCHGAVRLSKEVVRVCGPGMSSGLGFGIY